MTREVTIAAVQLPNAPHGAPDAEKRESNFDAAEAWLERAGRRGADIACLGETFNVLGLELTRQNVHAAIDGAVDEAVERLGAAARRHQMYVIAPVLGLQGDVVRNIALILDRQGALVGRYFKVHCIENEKAYGVTPGDAWPTFALDFGCIGVQICHDNSFPESARCLALNGAEIIFWPHVMGGWGGEFMDILLRSPAVHNGIYHVPVCYGCAPGYAWAPGMLIGRSSVIAPDGLVIADADRHAGIALARVDLDLPRVAHGFTRHGEWVWGVDMRNDRRPDTYGVLTRPHERTQPVPARDLIASSKEARS
ncbi:MAG: carbon-nitrogen hydrolase family protein [Anaerolineae bacterium]|nr:carbon-nitrogen hydrolase family protein [Anaerolineae bacterium]